MNTETESAPPADFASLLARVDPLIREVVARRLDFLGDEDREDAEQSLRLHLWSYALPRFDPRRGRLEAYAQRVIDNFLNSILDHRRPRRALVLLPQELQPHDQPRDEHHHDEVDFEGEQLRLSILARPELYLSPALARLLRALLDSPTREAAADKLGMSIESLYRTSARLRERIAELFSEVGLSRSQAVVRRAV